MQINTSCQFTFLVHLLVPAPSKNKYIWIYTLYEFLVECKMNGAHTKSHIVFKPLDHIRISVSVLGLDKQEELFIDQMGENQAIRCVLLCVVMLVGWKMGGHIVWTKCFFAVEWSWLRPEFRGRCSTFLPEQFVLIG